MRAGRAGNRDQQSQRRRTRGRAGCAVAHTDCPVGMRPGQCGRCRRARVGLTRSEEHTSELQSRQYLVCRLLLEKKNEGYKQKQTQGKEVTRVYNEGMRTA